MPALPACTRNSRSDAGQLEAALFRPQTGYYADIVAEAAALWESLSQNNPFVDGNKRTAFASMFTYLAINNIELSATAQEAQDFLGELYEANALTYDRLEAWLRLHTVKL